MTRKNLITAGPSKWDLMQSLFTGAKVQFTLDDGNVIWGSVSTLHKHRDEPRLSDNDANYHNEADRLDWLVVLDFDPSRYPNVCIAYIEFDMRTRSGIIVSYSDEEFQSTDFLYLPDEWVRMMKL